MKKDLRKAMAMIELIFAIVIMGIVMMSAPMLISTAAKSGYVGIQQEGINEAATQLNMILSYHWDENNTDEEYIDTLLTVAAGDSDLDKNTTTQRREGTPLESWRTYIREDGNHDLNASFATTFGAGNDAGESATDRDDIDDFHLTSTSLVVIANTDVDYADTVEINTSVSYIDDNASYMSSSLDFDPDYSSAPTGSTNIKHIKVTLTSTSGIDELDKTIVLHAFSCNIGAYQFESREK